MADFREPITVTSFEGDIFTACVDPNITSFQLCAILAVENDLQSISTLILRGSIINDTTPLSKLDLSASPGLYASMNKWPTFDLITTADRSTRQNKSSNTVHHETPFKDDECAYFIPCQIHNGMQTLHDLKITPQTQLIAFNSEATWRPQWLPFTVQAVTSDKKQTLPMRLPEDTTIAQLKRIVDSELNGPKTCRYIVELWDRTKDCDDSETLASASIEFGESIKIRQVSCQYIMIMRMKGKASFLQFPEDKPIRECLSIRKLDILCDTRTREIINDELPLSFYARNGIVRIDVIELSQEFVRVIHDKEYIIRYDPEAPVIAFKGRIRKYLGITIARQELFAGNTRMEDIAMFSIYGIPKFGTIRLEVKPPGTTMIVRFGTAQLPIDFQNDSQPISDIHWEIAKKIGCKRVTLVQSPSFFTHEGDSQDVPTENGQVVVMPLSQVISINLSSPGLFIHFPCKIRKDFHVKECLEWFANIIGIQFEQFLFNGSSIASDQILSDCGIVDGSEVIVI